MPPYTALFLTETEEQSMALEFLWGPIRDWIDCNLAIFTSAEAFASGKRQSKYDFVVAVPGNEDMTVEDL